MKSSTQQPHQTGDGLLLKLCTQPQINPVSFQNIFYTTTGAYLQYVLTFAKLDREYTFPEMPRNAQRETPLDLAFHLLEPDHRIKEKIEKIERIKRAYHSWESVPEAMGSVERLVAECRHLEENKRLGCPVRGIRNSLMEWIKEVDDQEVHKKINAEKDTALHICMRQKEWGLAEELIRKGANLDEKNQFDRTPRMLLLGALESAQQETALWEKKMQATIEASCSGDERQERLDWYTRAVQSRLQTKEVKEEGAVDFYEVFRLMEKLQTIQTEVEAEWKSWWEEAQERNLECDEECDSVGAVKENGENVPERASKYQRVDAPGGWSK